MSLTPILALQVPTINGDEDTWGAKLNTDLGILDLLGSPAVLGVASNFLIVAPTAPEAVYRVTSGGLTVTGTLPDPGTIPNKFFTVKLLDIGSILLQCVNTSVFIDGAPNYFLGNQYNFVRLLANGSSYDVVAQG